MPSNRFRIGLIFALIIVFIGILFVNLKLNPAYVQANEFLSYLGIADGLANNNIPLYSEEMNDYVNQYSREIGYYITSNHADQLLPLFSIILLTPLTQISDIEILKIIILTIIEVIAFVTGLLIIRKHSKNLQLDQQLLLIAAFAINLHVLLAIRRLDLQFIGLIMLTSYLIFEVEGLDGFEGVFLALTGFFLNILWILSLAFLVRAIFRKKSKVVIWYLGTIILLTIISMLFQPNWIRDLFRYAIGFFRDNKPWEQMYQFGIKTDLSSTMFGLLIVGFIILYVKEMIISTSHNEGLLTWSGLTILVYVAYILNRDPLIQAVLYFPAWVFIIASISQTRIRSTSKMVHYILVLLFIFQGLSYFALSNNEIVQFLYQGINFIHFLFLMILLYIMKNAMSSPIVDKSASFSN